MASLCENARNAFESRFPAPPDTRPRSSLPGYFRLPGCFWLLQLVVLLLLAPALLWAAPARRFSRMLLAPGGSRSPLLPAALGCELLLLWDLRSIAKAFIRSVAALPLVDIKRLSAESKKWSARLERHRLDRWVLASTPGFSSAHPRSKMP